MNAEPTAAIGKITSIMQVRRGRPPKLIGLGDDDMTHEDLIGALRGIHGLVDVGIDPPNFQFRSRPFLHFHANEEGIYADVRLGTGDFEAVPASTPDERLQLLARVADHVERLERTTKSTRDRRSRRH